MTPLHLYNIDTHITAAHQIRVHLQFLGHPIANDTVYADSKIWVRSISISPSLTIF